MMKRAVLIAGGVSRRICYKRYAHELAWWARELVARGYACVICHGDGSQHKSFEGIAAHTVFGDMESVSISLKWAGEAPERALVVCANHGRPEGLALWGGEALTPDAMRDALGAGGCERLVVMGQCHAGVFAPLANERTAVIGACGAGEPSYRCPAPLHELYDEFIYQLGCALFGAPPDGRQEDPASVLTVAQAFERARERDRCRQEHPWIEDPSGLAERWKL